MQYTTSSTLKDIAIGALVLKSGFGSIKACASCCSCSTLVPPIESIHCIIT